MERVAGVRRGDRCVRSGSLGIADPPCAATCLRRSRVAGDVRCFVASFLDHVLGAHPAVPALADQLPGGTRCYDVDFGMLKPARLRSVLIVLIVLVMICCTASAILSLRGEHTARSASTFFAGLAFSILFITRMPKKNEQP